MAGPYRYYLGPWLNVGGIWTPPVGTVGCVDLATLAEQATATGSTRRLGFFATTQLLDSRWTLLGLGDLREIAVTSLLRSTIASLLGGYSPAGSTLDAVLWDLLTNGSDPVGLARVRPLLPTSRNRLELYLGGHSLIRTEKFTYGAHPHTNRVRDVLRNDFRVLFQAAQAGQLRDSEHHRRALDYWQKQYGVNPWQEFVPADLRPSVPGPLPHQTLISDNFNRANQSGLGTSAGGWTWSHLSGTTILGVNSSTARYLSSAGSEDVARANSDLSSANHYARISDVFLSWGGAGQAIGAGTITRKDGTSTLTYYLFDHLIDGAGAQTLRLAKVVSNVFTSLGTVSEAISGATREGRSDGSRQSLWFNGVERIVVTDTSITTGLRTGLRVGSVGSGSTWDLDNFQAGDEAPTPTSQTYAISGTHTFTWPAGVNSATAEAWGGGGKGGNRTNNGVTGGGGGGAYSRGTLSRGGNTTETVTVGAGSTSTSAGEDSWVRSATDVMAKGGLSVANNSATGVAGGASASGFGTTKFSGGTGGNGVASTAGGGGGAAAGTANNGAAGSGATGGVGTNGGGSGGNGVAVNLPGTPGWAPGGGGAGAYRSAGTIVGGDGAPGMVVITWDTVQAVGSSAGTSTAAATGAARAATAGASTGVATTQGTGAALAAASGGSAAAAAAAAQGSAVAEATGTAVGAATAEGVGDSEGGEPTVEAGYRSLLAYWMGGAAVAAEAPAAGAGSSAGTSTVSGVGAALVSAAGTSAGTSTATGTSGEVVSATGSGAGTSTAQATGAALAASAGASAGTSTAEATGHVLIAATGTSAGTATATGVGAALAPAVGTSAGVSAVNGAGAVLVPATGSAAGTSTAFAVSGGEGITTGSSAGTSTAAGVGASRAAGAGTSAGTATAQGVGASLVASAGTAAGTSAATGAANLLTPAAGTSSGSSTTAGTAAALARGVGTSAGSSTAVAASAFTGGATGQAAGIGTAAAVGAALVAAAGLSAGTSTAFGTSLPPATTPRKRRLVRFVSTRRDRVQFTSRRRDRVVW